jgi:hypothetical protein
MSEDGPIEQRPLVQPDLSEKSAWHAVQQGAQVFAELGGGAAGFATAAHLGRTILGGSRQSESNATPQQQQPTPSSEE